MPRFGLQALVNMDFDDNDHAASSYQGVQPLKDMPLLSIP